MYLSIGKAGAGYTKLDIQMAEDKIDTLVTEDSNMLGYEASEDPVKSKLSERPYL